MNPREMFREFILIFERKAGHETTPPSRIETKMVRNETGPLPRMETGRGFPGKGPYAGKG